MTSLAKKAREVVKGAGQSHVLPVGAQLRPEVKRRIVELFACFSRVSEVRDAIRDEFGLDLSPQRIRRYDCSKRDCAVSGRLKSLFAVVRKRYLDDITDIDVAHQAHRLRVLSRMTHVSEENGNFTTAAQLLRQAAEEVGGVMSGHRTVDVRHVHLSAEDAKAELAMRLSAFLEETVPALPSPQGDKDS